MSTRRSRAALFAASFVVGLGVCELIVRGVAPQDIRIQTPGMYARDSATGYRLTPNFTGTLSNRVEYRTTVRTDSRGLRVPATDSGAQRPQRILMLGDSFVFGQGVDAEEALPLQLQHALESRNQPVSVLNGGVVGYSTVQELAWLERFGTTLEPGVIGLGFFLGNDIQDNRTSAMERFIRGVVTTPPPEWHTPVTAWLYQHSHLYVLARKLPEALLDRGRQGPDAANGIVRKYRPPNDSVYRQEVSTTAAALASLDSVSRSVGAKLVVALIPEAMQIEATRQDRARRLAAADPIQLDFDQPNRLVGHLLDSLGIRWIDLTPSFRTAASAGAKLYYPIDGHFTREGYALAGRVFAGAVDSVLAATPRGAASDRATSRAPRR